MTLRTTSIEASHVQEGLHDASASNIHIQQPEVSQPQIPTHFYIDVPNPEESSYDQEECHIAIDPGFKAQLQADNDQDISNFLALPEIIPTKKRKRQQALLDFTQSIILTSREYVTGLE
jgi:hypothetical protein